MPALVANVVDPTDNDPIPCPPDPDERPEPRAEPWWDTLSLTYELVIDEREAAYLRETFTVFLGAHGNFDFWGSPADGRVISVGCNGCRSTGYGGRDHWRWSISARDMDLTEAGETWGDL